MPSVSCIIPAYNEESRIESVLKIVCGHQLISEVIVVDDGSTDDTKNIVSKFNNAKLIAHEKNLGKSHSVADGIILSDGEFIFLLDADLSNLTATDITRLIQPVISGEADVSISLRQNSLWVSKLIGFDFISGERVFSRKLVQDHFEEIKKLCNFGLEVYLNKLIIKNKYKIKIVNWPKVDSPWPTKKKGWSGGVKSFVLMEFDIFKTVSFFEIMRQLVRMYFLKVKI